MYPIQNHQANILHRRCTFFSHSLITELRWGKVKMKTDHSDMYTDSNVDDAAFSIINLLKVFEFSV